MPNLQVIGNEIYYEGCKVAVITHSEGTLLEDFRNIINDVDAYSEEARENAIACAKEDAYDEGNAVGLSEGKKFVIDQIRDTQPDGHKELEILLCELEKNL